MQAVLSSLEPVWRARMRLACRRACAAVSAQISRVRVEIEQQSLGRLQRLAEAFPYATELELREQASPQVDPSIADVLAQLPHGAWRAMQRATVAGDPMSREAVSAVLRAFPALQHISCVALHPGPVSLNAVAALAHAASTLTSVDLRVFRASLRTDWDSPQGGFEGLAAGLRRLPRLSRLSLDVAAATDDERFDLSAATGELSGLRHLRLLGAEREATNYLCRTAATGALTGLTSLSLGRGPDYQRAYLSTPCCPYARR